VDRRRLEEGLAARVKLAVVLAADDGLRLVRAAGEELRWRQDPGVDGERLVADAELPRVDVRVRVVCRVSAIEGRDDGQPSLVRPARMRSRFSFGRLLVTVSSSARTGTDG